MKGSSWTEEVWPWYRLMKLTKSIVLNGPIRVSQVTFITWFSHQIQATPGRAWSWLRDVAASERALGQAEGWRNLLPNTTAAGQQALPQEWSGGTSLGQHRPGSQTALVLILALPLQVRSYLCVLASPSTGWSQQQLYLPRGILVKSKWVDLGKGFRNLPEPVLSILQIFANIVLIISFNLKYRYFCLHFAHQKTDTSKGWVTCLRPPRSTW